MARNDILIPLEIEPMAEMPPRSRFAALVPITVALVGVLAVLIGGVSARNADYAARHAIDPVMTGSVTPAK
ncbi:MAG: hypothetical protein J0H94_18075 [Rhizobiales bacterium]|jgi:hypothetical protein|nr:hypothetical protein [Hyphomicrobiales bacterium]